MSVTIRRAGPGDAAELARLRWDFRLEDQRDQSLEAFSGAFAKWLADALASDWTAAVADDGTGTLIGCIFLRSVSKVPNPGALNRAWGYVTSSYAIVLRSRRIPGGGRGARRPRRPSTPRARPVMKIRRSTMDELPDLQLIREAAFAPVFASFRSILGERIYRIAQAPGDAAQGDMLASLLEDSSGWEVYTAEASDRAVGFVAIRFDEATGVGEIGLNAVHPDFAGRGIGTALYEFALDEMAARGLAVATVGTGGDPSHAPARRAYEKVGFNVGIPSVWMCCDRAERAAMRDGERE